ncbi:GNAT family N-acetyltransferase [Kordia sp.]|uniref:GNAT family N-acetyltransferase n=1 Tax=Kordia sp. TaxID=1965332 RepID=UPI003D2A4B89
MITFNFEDEYIIENEVVKLSPLRIESYTELKEIAFEPELWKYTPPEIKNEEDLKNYIQSTLDNRAQKREYPFIVFDKRTQKYAGVTRLFQISTTIKALRIGYTWYGKEFHGTGLNKNCKYVLFEFIFEKLGFERIGLGAHAENKRSIAAMKSVGCKQEGIFRNIFPAVATNGRADAVLVSILRDEWLTTEKKMLQKKLVSKNE